MALFGLSFAVFEYYCCATVRVAQPSFVPGRAVVVLTIQYRTWSQDRLQYLWNGIIPLCLLIEIFTALNDMGRRAPHSTEPHFLGLQSRFGDKPVKI